VPASLAVDLYGTAVAGSPFSVTLTRVCPDRCEATGDGVQRATPGTPAGFEVLLRDRCGSAVRLPGARLHVSLSGADGAPLGHTADVAFDEGSGSYRGQYTIAEAERQPEARLSVKIFGRHVAGSPFGVGVRLKPLHMLPGIVHDFPVDRLSEWALVYDKPYNHATMTSSFPTFGEWLFVCAALEGSATIPLGAFAERSVVTQDNTGSDTVAFLHHGAYWYWRPHRAVGFAPSSQIALNHADTLDEGSAERLSWHFQQAGNGGWRVGDVKGLEKDPGRWRKRVYVWPAASEPDGCL